MKTTVRDCVLLGIGLILVLIFLQPFDFIMYILVPLIPIIGGIIYFLSTMWVTSEGNQWLLIIENGKMVKAGVGMKTIKYQTQQAVTFPSTISGVSFSATQVTKENFGVEIEGIVFWTVYREEDGPFRCYKYTQGSDADQNVRQVAESIMRSQISNTELLSLLRKRIDFRKQVTDILREQLKGWGIWAETVEITEIRISSNQLFRDMQTEFRLNVEKASTQAKNKTKAEINDDRTKYDLELKAVITKNQVEEKTSRNTEEMKRKGLQAKLQEKQAAYDKELLQLTNKLEQERQKWDAEKQKMLQEYEIKYQRLRHEQKLKSEEQWNKTYDLMNEKNIKIKEIDYTQQMLNNINPKISGNQFVGSENIMKAASIVPAMGLVTEQN